MDDVSFVDEFKRVIITGITIAAIHSAAKANPPKSIERHWQFISGMHPASFLEIIKIHIYRKEN